MIDETLYQLATDELNSDQRKPDIWARACALASNDHDEARYLYTNLRVEQMLAHQAKAERDLAHGGGRPNVEDDLTLELLDETQDISVESTRTGQTSNMNQQAEGLELEGEASHSSIIGNEGGLELSDKEFDLNPEDVANMNAAEPGTASSIHGNVTQADLPASVENASAETKAITMEDNPLAYWAQQHQEQLRLGEEQSKRDNGSALNKELERQADELPGNHSEIVAVESNSAPTLPSADDIPKVKPTYNMPDRIASIEEQSTPQVEAALESQRQLSSAESPTHFDYADDDDMTANGVITTPTSRLGGGKRFYVYSRYGKTHAVKDGVSWPAMLLTLPWLLAKGMIGTGIVYAVLWLVLIAGLLSTGFAWMDAAPNATTAIKVWTALFALVSLIALFYLPFRHGNEWFQKKLQRRGYELEALVHAKNRKEAIDSSFDSAAF